MLSSQRRPGLFQSILAFFAASSILGINASYDLQPDDSSNVKSIAKDMAADMMQFYAEVMNPGVPGDLKPPYYWWEAGALMGILIDYWKLTGDETYNQNATDGLVHQTGKYNDYMPDNQTLTEGNDDQGFWGMSVLSAAELEFAPAPNKPGWLALAQAIFNTQAARWDTEHCNGGLRWQIFTWNNGYDYKNTISQGTFFNMAARLALYTGNTSYSDWAEKTYEWVVEKNYIDNDYNVYDGAYISDGCTALTPYQWTYNNGVFMHGAAAMYNLTGSDVWKSRLDGLIKGAEVFFRGDDNNIMTEVACETVDRCNYDQQSFKAYLTRWMASVTKWAPYTASTIKPYLRATSLAAAKQCLGGSSGRLCGLKWYTGAYDNTSGLGMQMAALEAVMTNLIDEQPDFLTAKTGGTSQGDASAGGEDINSDGKTHKKASLGSKVGAGVLTAFVLGCLLAGIVWMLKEESTNLMDVITGSAIGNAAGGASLGSLFKKGDSKTAMQEVYTMETKVPSPQPSMNPVMTAQQPLRPEATAIPAHRTAHPSGQESV
ncbi:Mannan endo-1,6-alpha-mannosidase DCW1 [Ceratocystis fimbriata CBS 114723]|uniref:mannan endo-1,6-alpha-mannosidase n=2 Tax=Ceratocystis TaxID=5157 RepID=A0A0F8DFR3_CERFI|nr:Mannan endo-1 6-alpha-mannosidase DCW1 [Ceratocystis platani]PHH50872.1 Mannan endo-1,6-alpha-mannosidase DCW1 [Ceratocystis fimbriata CBS 114723]